MTRPARLLVLALLAGCSTNPVTGRDQFVELPAVQAHADIGFALATSAQRIAFARPCGEACRDEEQSAKFGRQVTRIGLELEIAARGLSPELFKRIGSFDIGVDTELGTATGSSAGGRVALGSGIAQLEPDDHVTAFIIAREMAHVIARHDEEDSGVRLFTSALTTLLPGFNLIVRFFASTLGSGALVRSWAAGQRREADEIAVALLERTGRSTAEVSRSLAEGLKKERLGESLWATRYAESADRVALLAELPPRFADFGE